MTDKNVLALVAQAFIINSNHIIITSMLKYFFIKPGNEERGWEWWGKCFMMF